jgi:hypothetical protein
MLTLFLRSTIYTLLRWLGSFEYNRIQWQMLLGISRGDSRRRVRKIWNTPSSWTQQYYMSIYHMVTACLWCYFTSCMCNLFTMRPKGLTWSSFIVKQMMKNHMVAIGKSGSWQARRTSIIKLRKCWILQQYPNSGCNIQTILLEVLVQKSEIFWDWLYYIHTLLLL